MTAADTSATVAITARLPYSLNTGTKPVNDLTGPLSGAIRRSAEKDPHAMPMHDGRPLRDQFDIDVHGFELVDQASAVTNFFDTSQIETI